MSRKQIGNFSSEIIKLLDLDIPVGTPIYIAADMDSDPYLNNLLFLAFLSACDIDMSTF